MKRKNGEESLNLSRPHRYICAALIATAAVCLAAAGLARAKSAPQQQMTLDAVLRQLDAQSSDFTSLTADIERTKVTVVVDDKSVESGKIYIRKDEKMRIDMTSPDPRTILRYGDTVDIYTPKINQVDEYNLGKHKEVVDQFTLLGFGTSGADLKKHYDITLQGEDTLDNRKVVMLELTPKSSDVRNQISKVQIWFDESTWLPAQQKFFETGSGDYFTTRYTNVARNIRIPDSRFRPQWPKGVTKVKQDG
ncbi:MAG: outer membrane lipoprotein carrier protein LolA [Candidatus Acidiferrales bacterium]